MMNTCLLTNLKILTFLISVMSPEVDVLVHVTCSDCPLSESVCLAG